MLESEESVSEEDGFLTTTLTTTLTLSLHTLDKAEVGGDDSKYRVDYDQRCGRMLVAAEFIPEGSTILVDTPACTGPDNNTKPVCLGAVQ